MVANKKNVVYGAVVVVVAAAAAYFVVGRVTPEADQPIAAIPPTTIGTNGSLDFSRPFNEQVGSIVEGWKTMRNRDCGFTYKIPAGWTVTSMLGESKIFSPEDIRENEVWARAHKDVLAKEEGDAPLEEVSSSLYISCETGVAAPPTARLVRNVVLGGLQAKEFSLTVPTSDGAATTTYEIVTEGGEKTLDIQLAHDEYSRLSDTVKMIIASIKFDN